MDVVFRHAHGFKVTEEVFRATWVTLCARHPVNPPAQELPRLPRRTSILEMDQNGQQRSLEYLCKTLVPNGYKGRSQASKKFLEQNPHVVRATAYPVKNPASGKWVDGVELVGVSEYTLASNIEARFEADVDSEGDDGSEEFGEGLDRIPVLREDANGLPAPVQGLAPSATAAVTFSAYVSEFVTNVHQQPYFRIYRGKRMAPVVEIVGWDARLAAYFWPTPIWDWRPIMTHWRRYLRLPCNSPCQ